MSPGTYFGDFSEGGDIHSRKTKLNEHVVKELELQKLMHPNSVIVQEVIQPG